MMATLTELRVHVVVLWQGDVIHTALLAPGQTFVLGDAQGAWPCPASALGGARSHVLLRVEPHGAHFLPPTGAASWLACGEHASIKLEHFSVLASAGVVDGQVRRFRTTRWDARLVAALGLTALAHVALLAVCAFSLPPLDATALSLPAPELTHSVSVAIGSFAEPELDEREPDIVPEPSEWIYTIDGWARCGNEFEMGTPALFVDGRFGTAGPKDNPDPHLPSEIGPARPALEALADLAPAKPDASVPEKHRSPKTLTAPWGRETALGTDPESARAPMFGEKLAESWGEDVDGKRRALGGTAKLLEVAEAAPSAPRLPPRVVHTGLRVDGALEQRRVSDTMLSQLSAFRACYAASVSDASERSHLELVFDIGADGSVTSGSAAHAESVDPSVVNCMLQAALILRFDVAAGDTKVRYPLLLIPPAPLT